MCVCVESKYIAMDCGMNGEGGVLTEISSESDGVLIAVGSGGGGGSDFPRLRLFPCRLTLVHSEEGEGGGRGRRGRRN